MQYKNNIGIEAFYSNPTGNRANHYRKRRRRLRPVKQHFRSNFFSRLDVLRTRQQNGEKLATEIRVYAQ